MCFILFMFIERKMLSLYTENDGFILVFEEYWHSLYWIYDGYLLGLYGNLAKKHVVNLVYSTKTAKIPKNFKKKRRNKTAFF